MFFSVIEMYFNLWISKFSGVTSWEGNCTLRNKPAHFSIDWCFRPSLKQACVFSVRIFFFFFLTASPNLSVHQCRSWVEGKHIGVPREACGVLQPLLFALAVRWGSEGCLTAGGILSVMANSLATTRLRWTEAGSSDISGGLFSARLFKFSYLKCSLQCR